MSPFGARKITQSQPFGGNKRKLLQTKFKQNLKIRGSLTNSASLFNIKIEPTKGEASEVPPSLADSTAEESEGLRVAGRAGLAVPQLRLGAVNPRGSHRKNGKA